MNESWTIAELAELAAEALATPEGVGQANGRVRDVPNERLIRWYGTVGLVDPPLSRRGRVARYGRRHLLQLVAVKRRQAEGRSLAQIQEELAGATDDALAAVARVPALGSALAPLAPGAPQAPDRFWARRPMQPDAAESMPGSDQAGTDQAGTSQAGTSQAGTGQAGTGQAGTGQHGADPGGAGAAGLVHGVRLAPGVLLLLDGADLEPGPQDLTAIVNAARPLLRELASRGLCAFGPRHPAENGPSADGSRI